MIHNTMNEKAQTATASKMFLNGIIKGMAAPGLIYAAVSVPQVQVPEVKTVSTGLRARPLSVWQAVGEDIRTAARKYEQTGS